MARDQAAPWVAVGSGGIDVGVATRRSWDWFPARRCCLPSYSRRFGSRCSLLRTALLILELLYYGPKLDIFSIEIVTECKSLNPQRDGRREIRMEKSLLKCSTDRSRNNDICVVLSGPWEILKDVKAIWLRNPKEYTKFYHSLAKDMYLAVELKS